VSLFGIRQRPTLPGVQPWLFCAHWVPPWLNLAKYYVARLLGWADNKELVRLDMKKPQLKLRLKAALHEALPGVARGLFCVHWTPPTGNLAKYNVVLG